MSDRTSNGRLFERYRGVRYEIGIAGNRCGRFDPNALVEGYGARIFGARAGSYDLALADIRGRVQFRIGLMLVGSVHAIEPLCSKCRADAAISNRFFRFAAQRG